MKSICLEIHHRIYPGTNEVKTFFSPGRVNLIGEHVDYNGGYVMPLALSIGNVGCISLRNDQKIRFYSENFSSFGIVEVSLSDLEYKKEHGWSNYAKGIVKFLLDNQYEIKQGFDVTILGNLPFGAGLSSSASIEALVITMMNEIFDLKINKTDLAIFSRAVENNYIHVNCGIMDQFIILNGIKDHALLLDTSTLEYIPVLMLLEDYDIVICNSRVKRGLVDSKYNERRSECDASLNVFQKFLNVKDLCSITEEQFFTYEDKLPNDILRKRSRHAIFENARTLKTFDALKRNDIVSVGRYLTESHLSLKNDYEVSCRELDLLVDAAMHFGSLGSRMTGAGFGGCTVNIVKKSDFDSFKRNVEISYLNATGLYCEILKAEITDGTKEI